MVEEILRKMALEEFGTLDDVVISWSLDSRTGRVVYTLTRPPSPRRPVP